MVITTFKSFEPDVSIQSLTQVSVAEPFSKFPGKFRQLRIAVRNDGRFPIWLPPNESLVPDDAWQSHPASGDPTYVELEFYQDPCTKLASSESRVYELVLHADYKHFRLGIHARDWRGRDGYKHLGFHEIPQGDL